jgi:predicted O-linked N-acetylglucosamine transferase (SPINDLY family)
MARSPIEHAHAAGGRLARALIDGFNEEAQRQQRQQRNSPRPRNQREREIAERHRIAYLSRALNRHTVRRI